MIAKLAGASLALAVVLALVTVPASADAQSAPTVHRGVAPPYRNPLALQLPDGSQAASCADPFVLNTRRSASSGSSDSALRASGSSDSALRASGSSAPTTWYLYCTSDALTATELGPDGTPLIHNVPMFSSTDLTHWTYRGDAFPTKPSWITGGMWAPDVVQRGSEYLMYFTASDTNLPGGGSAVALATSTSPTGPWQVSPTPVVPPMDAPNGGGRRWEFDPEVISAHGTDYLYFGSYFGGIFARTLSADGRTSNPASETQIAIDNRYEGTFIVQRDGWFYFMGSATNCCNGPLTGYAVFAARSRSPLGPFLDADGRSILDSRVGGTPMLTQNGNRWVGPGHNAVITDYSGQDWVVYHAVNSNDPYYAGDVGYTKRPALIDPLDWRDGWPVVRGDQGPSDQWQPGPAAQPGERTAYVPRYQPDPRPGRVIRSLSDDFSGSVLSNQWTWVRPPADSEYDVAGGSLNWQTENADLHPPATPLASVLTEPAPVGDYIVEAKVRTTVPATGCCQNYVQGGVLIYGSDGNYVKLASVSIWNTRQTEFGRQNSAEPTGYPTYGNTVVGPVGDWTYLRIVRHRVCNQDRYTAYTSLDGRHWDHGGTWSADLGTARIGLVSMGGAGFSSSFDYIHVYTTRNGRS